MPTLTRRQKQILDYINFYINKFQLSPTFEEIRKHLRLKAFSTVHEHVQALIDKGFLTKNSNLARGLEINKPIQMIRIPLIGTIAAGQPIEAVEEKETIAIPKNKYYNSNNIYALKVAGDSMMEENINDGDYVIVKQQPTAENGQKVVALIDSSEATLKKYYLEKNKIRLQPANQTMLPLFYEKNRVDIQGVVLDIVKTHAEVHAGQQPNAIANTEKIARQKPYYEKPNFSLYHANCIDVLAQMPENSVDMIFADPPYNLSNGGFSVHAGKMVSVNKGNWDKSKGFNDDYAFHYKWLEACRRVLKPHGTLWISGTYHSIYQCGHALQSLGYHILNDIAWFKPNASPNLSCRFFTASHETIIWARKEKKAKHIFNYNLMKNGDWTEDALKKPGLQMRSVWSMGTPKPSEKKFGKHPTQKPISLLQRIVLASTKKGDLIIDPFAGSSTTGIAAHFYDRKYIGIDMEKKFLDLSIKRYEELKQTLSSKN